MAARVQGEVYQAKDTRLECTVAIKILPEHLADNAERKERFGREARAISQLNHPNICTLFDVGEQDGIDYLVMEYVEGETLAERLTKGALPLDEALEYGIQIADGLDNAHRAGIVHRDLKPGNAMLTKLGVKLLDFGLAKLIESNEPSDDSQAPTLQKNLTRERAIMGTPRYMAPEQLEGGKADARTDLYAFGLVLREMLVGPKATSGESELSPPALRRVIEKCLDRDPDARWQTARDLTDELRWIASKPDETESPNVSLTQKPIVPVASVLLGALAASAFWWALSSPAPARLRAASHFRLDLPEEVGVRGGNYSNPLVISRDGANIVFQAHDSDGVRHLYVRSLSEPDATLIPGTARADMPFLSWDGTTVGYFLPSGEIESVLLAGGAPRKISDAPLMRSGVAWGSDDTIVVSSAGLLWRVSASGGTLEPLQRPRPVEGDWGHRWPQFLPDGKTVLFTIQGVDGFRPALVSMETGDYHVVEELGMGRGARYLDSGHVVLAAEGQLLAARFDLDRLEATSRPVPVHDGIYTSPESGLAYFTTSDDGDLLYRSAGDPSRQQRLVLVDRSGNASALFEERGYFRTVRFSPDGEKIAVTRSNSERPNLDVWIYDVATGRRDRLTTAGADRQAIWLPDGTRITFTRRLLGGESFLVKRVGGDVEEELRSRLGRSFLGSWALDGSALAFYEMHPETRGDLWILNLDGATEPWLATEFSEVTPRFSPDGRWLAYASDDTGGYEIYVRPYPGPGEKALISTSGGVDPVWSPDGRELFYRNGRDVMAVSIETEPSFSASRPEQLFTGPYLSEVENPGTIKDHYDISPDGEHFLMIETDPTPSDSEIHLILDWGAELERLIPNER